MTAERRRDECKERNPFGLSPKRVGLGSQWVNQESRVLAKGVALVVAEEGTGGRHLRLRSIRVKEK